MNLRRQSLALLLLAGYACPSFADGLSFAPAYKATYTPTATYATTGNQSFSYVAQQGNYTYDPSSGLVCVQMALVWTGTYTTASGQFRITLPIVSTNAVQSQFTVTTNTPVTWPAGGTSLLANEVTVSGVTYLVFQAAGSAINAANFTSPQFVSGTQYQVGASGCYFAY